MCQHQPACPPADEVDHEAARVVASRPEQGWSLLCNGVVLFDDTGALLPGGQSIAPHRPTVTKVPARRPRLPRRTLSRLHDSLAAGSLALPPDALARLNDISGPIGLGPADRTQIRGEAHA